jgi:hypothetical protein
LPKTKSPARKKLRKQQKKLLNLPLPLLRRNPMTPSYSRKEKEKGVRKVKAILKATFAGAHMGIGIKTGMIITLCLLAIPCIMDSGTHLPKERDVERA